MIFIVHGFTNDIDTPWIKEMKNAIFSMKSDCVVGMVGWGRGAELHYLRPGHSYAQAVGNTMTVGKWLAKHVKAYKDKGYETYGVGHSLGAHVMGIAGRNSQGKLDRISGLDPAGPCFETKNQENRLARTDAKFVDVVHTDGYYPHPYFPGAWICKHYGTLIPLGHMDFYPNYGYDQPGIGLHIAGSHERSYELFIWSITNPGKFRTQDLCRTRPDYEKPCDKFVKGEIGEMGFYADTSRSRSGNYFIKTNGAAPWV